MDRNFHPVADLFPLMRDEEYEALKLDIQENGLLEPIWLHPDGRIIDGRNRYRACSELGIAPPSNVWKGEGSLVEFVLSLNLHRRHLSQSQKATVAVRLLPMLEEEAKERQAHGKTAPGRTLVEKLPQASADKSRDKAGAAVGVSGKMVSEAKAIEKKDKKLFTQVQSGEKSVAQAKRIIVKQEKKESPPLPTMGKYRVFYADPPWSYGNSGVINESDGYGHAQRHYPTMTIAELCKLEIKGMAEKDAVLFMWVTSPLLAECFPVIKAWGFQYKTSFVWDKVKHNFGHYNSVRHELLLVCTRGSCTPDEKKLYDSVIVCERTNIHSEKPEIFRQMIDTLYPNGNRIELFARCEMTGWNSWGNE